MTVLFFVSLMSCLHDKISDIHSIVVISTNVYPSHLVVYRKQLWTIFQLYTVIETRPYKAEKWFIVVFYKPPNVKDKHFATVFSELCQSLQRESSHWFVMGDTNFDMKTDNLLCDLCVTYNLTNLLVVLLALKVKILPQLMFCYPQNLSVLKVH